VSEDVSDAPDYIYLQWAATEVTWCVDRIDDDTDVEYMRSDLTFPLKSAQSLIRERDRLKAENKLLRGYLRDNFAAIADNIYRKSMKSYEEVVAEMNEVLAAREEAGHDTPHSG
jgi:hypothetical protein